MVEKEKEMSAQAMDWILNDNNCNLSVHMQMQF